MEEVFLRIISGLKRGACQQDFGEIYTSGFWRGRP
jgi:hypothetical protein